MTAPKQPPTKPYESSSNLRPILLTLRAETDEQAEAWKTAAERAGLKLSAWIRVVCDRAAKRKASK